MYPYKFKNGLEKKLNRFYIKKGYILHITNWYIEEWVHLEKIKMGTNTNKTLKNMGIKRN